MSIPNLPPQTLARSSQLRGRLALALGIASLLPMSAMDVLVLTVDLWRLQPLTMHLVVFGTGFAGAALGFGIGWAVGGMVLHLAQDKLRESTDKLTRLMEQLDADRERLAYALEGSRLALWDLDVATGMVHLSPEWSVMLGGPERETTVPIAELIALVPEEERQACWNGVMAVFRNQSHSYDLEHRVVRPDGSEIWVRSRGTVTARWPDGRAARMTGTNSDVTLTKSAEIALRESEAKMRLVTDNLPIMIVHFDADLRYLFANRPYLDFFDVKQESLAGRRLADVAGPEAEDAVLSRIEDLRAGRTVVVGRERTDGEGRARHYELRLVPRLDGEGQLASIFALIDDVTESLEAQRDLNASAAKLQLVTDGVSSMIAHLDLEGHVLFANRRCREFYGVGGGNLSGTKVADLAGIVAGEYFRASLPQLVSGLEVSYDREFHVGNEARHIEFRLVPHRAPSGEIDSVFAILNDVTDRVLTAQVLEQQAFSDPLTGLPNKRLLLDRLDRALAQARRNSTLVAVLFMDLDGFKGVNDLHGHAAGDALLRQVASRLMSCVRSADTVARVGGDEFVVVLEACRTAQDSENVASKLVGALALPYELSDGAVASISCSVGIALHPSDADESDALIRSADSAMYRAKQGGKNRFAHITP